MQTEQPRIPRWMLVALAAAVVAALVGGVWFYRAEQARARAQASDQIGAIVQLKVDQIESWRADQFHDATLIARNRFLVSSVAEFLATGSAASRDALHTRFHRIADEHDFADIMLVRTDGRLAYSLDGSAAAPACASEVIRQAWQQRTALATDLHVGSFPWAHLSVAAPILPLERSDAPALGVLLFIHDAAQYLYPMLSVWPTPSRTAETLLVRREGDDVLYLNALRHRPDAALKLRVPLSQKEVPAVMAVLGVTGFVQGIDYRGVPVAAYVAPVPNSPWFVVGKIDETEVFSEWRQDAVRLIAMLAVVVCTILAFGGLAWQRGAKRHYRALYESQAQQARLHERLEQAQRLESVGRLAGGVAHDFNNMLAVILGYADLALARLPASDPIREDLTEIQQAAQRSAELTAQLLAFARKQTIAPRVLDLNETIEGLLRLLRRLIGEDIVLAWHPASDLWPVRMDPAQVNQILVNLVTNARDAIGGNGHVTIETRRAVLDRAYCDAHPGAVPGDYVQLTVSDDGPGIPSEVMEHLFEPFFTTKPLGEGTGLGLATVYGIVRQNDGFIQAYSEPGHGTTFKAYLPRYAGEVSEAVAEPVPVASGRGETVLLVEDEPAMLKMTAAMIESLGYRPLPASTPGDALKLADSHAGPIAALLTDVVMPEMNGRQLADRLRERRPGVACLFMSGYTANVIVHRGVVDAGLHFIQKPFTATDLAAALRNAIDEAARPGGPPSDSAAASAD